MFDVLIIDARRYLGWRRRVASDISTAALWVGWMLLWTPVFRKLHEVIRLHVQFELAAREILDTVTPIPVVHSIVALLGTSTLLLSWSMLPKRGVGHARPTLTTVDYASHFAIDERQIASGLHSRICVVSHDGSGAITGIVPAQLAHPAAVPAPPARILQLEAA